MNSEIGHNASPESWRRVQQQVGLLGESEKIRQLLETIEQVAPTDISVLITGESGTGKELVARAIHMRSRRHEQPLVTVNCGAIPEGLIESELFGHEKGSFTGAIGSRRGYFEQANHGSIFLDEVGDLPLVTQVKLLRVLEVREFMRVGGTATQQVDVRLITATHKDLEQEVRKGHFREDLFFRLNAVHLYVPSLRERIEDIPILVRKFSNDFCRENHIDFEGFSESGLHALMQYHWPGNIRELRNIVEKVIVLERGHRVDETLLRKYLRTPGAPPNNLPVPINLSKEEVEREFLLRVLLEIKSEIAQLRDILINRTPVPYPLNPWREDQTIDFYETSPEQENAERKGDRRSVAEMEKEMIRNALLKTGGNKRKSARLLGLSERTLYRKIERYGLK
jgi:DNA-binding NtrC family response regulator